MKKIIALSKDPQLVLQNAYKRKGVNPILSLEEAIKGADSFGEIDYKERAKSKIHHPKDLTLRELAYISPQLGIRLETLIQKIHDGFVPETVENVKAITFVEKAKNKELSFRITEYKDEAKEYRKRIIELETQLENEGRNRLQEVDVLRGRDASENTSNDRGKENQGAKENRDKRDEMENPKNGENGEVQPNGDFPSGNPSRIKTEIHALIAKNEGVGTYKGPLSGSYGD